MISLASFLLLTISAWQSEIEAAGTRVVIARVYTDPARNELRLPDGTPERSLVARLLSDEALVGQFVRAHALTINIGKTGVVLINMARVSEFAGHEEALIGHEFGHIWLEQKGFRAATGGRRLCVGIHASDIVQHVAIRSELARRGIDQAKAFVFALEQAIPRIGDDPGDACQQLQRLAMWVDVELGLKPENWARLAAFKAALRKSYPELEAHVSEIVCALREANLQDPGEYTRVLSSVFARLNSLIQ